MGLPAAGGVLDIAIVGAGLGGVCAAIRLRATQGSTGGAGGAGDAGGAARIVVLERASQVGGTWRDNVYPGCACDVPSHLYSLSFEPKRDWSRPYPQQQEIQQYILRVVDKYALRPLIRLNTKVLQLRWLAEQGLWQIDLQLDGINAPPLLARHVVLATGPLNKPLIPELPGLSEFKGPSFHSSQWRHDLSLAGRRIAVVGTGASAVQFVPEIALQAAQVHVFQRTAAWVLPRWDKPYGAAKKWVYACVPGLQRLSRWRVYWFNELVGMGFMGAVWMQNNLRRLALMHLRAQVPDEPLRRALTPDFAPGCKRLLISNTWFPTLQRPNVNLVTQPVTRVQAEGVVSADGVLHPCDVIIWGTGFKAAQMVSPLRIFGEAPIGQAAPELGAQWREHPAQSHLGITVAGFPNLYMLVGPNTGLGHNSIIFMIEAQVDYVARALTRLRRKGGAVLRLKVAVQAATYGAVQHAMKRTVWASGCHSWYQNERGQIDTLWPGFTWRYWLKTRRFNAADFE